MKGHWKCYRGHCGSIRKAGPQNSEPLGFHREGGISPVTKLQTPADTAFFSSY